MLRQRKHLTLSAHPSPLAMNALNYIVWNPENSLIDLGFYSLRWYSLLFMLGFLFSYLILKRVFWKEGVPEEKLERLTIYVGLGAVLGARLGHCLFYDFDYYSENIAEIFLPFRLEPHFEFTGYLGLASHGGAIGILLALLLYARSQRMDLLWVLDKLALVIPLACFFIRMGNLMNSEIVGKPTNVAWAFIFKQLDAVPRHPAQLYEALAYLFIFITLNILYRKSRREKGFIFGMFLVFMFSARFLIEFIKADQSAFEAGMLLNMGQLLSIPFILAGFILLSMRHKKVEEPATPVPSVS